MQKYMYDVIDDLTMVALGKKSARQVRFVRGVPLSWRTAAIELESRKITLADALSRITGKNLETANFGDESKVFSGVHGKSANLVKLAPARRTNCYEKRPVRKVNKIIVRTMKTNSDGTKVCTKETTLVRKAHTRRTFVEA